jgi:hypothetical protein
MARFNSVLVFNHQFNMEIIMPFKSDKHRKWYFANKKGSGSSKSVGSGSGSKKFSAGRSKSSSNRRSSAVPFPTDADRPW